MNLQVVILAAGQGKRMNSDLPKVLHTLAGRSLLSHVVSTAQALAPRRICVVVGHGAGKVRAALGDAELAWATQEQQLGTGHAVQQALPQLDADATVLILYGDVPLIGEQTLRQLVDAASKGGLAVLTSVVDEPHGLGRIVRGADGRVASIVEERDASPEQRALREINTGVMAAPQARLAKWLASLDRGNAQGEYYLTDIVAAAVADGTPVETCHPSHAHEYLGVNSKIELAKLERHYQMSQSQRLLQAGVTLADPARIDVRGELTCGRDVSIDINCLFEGRVVLGDGVKVGANCILRDIEVGAGTHILPFCLLEDSVIGADARIGPYARIRPGTRLADEVRIGNFVEVKGSTLGRGSKANHLAYIGDTTAGAGVNFGAGVITCNYDGANKHATVIGDGVFIGSDVQLVAPVNIGAGATIAAGATITKDVAADCLALTEKKQVSKPGWQRPRKR